MNIALKEANETKYWLKLLTHTNYLSKEEYQRINEPVLELVRILASIVKTSKDNINKLKEKKRN